jgi:hypothetical protein
MTKITNLRLLFLVWSLAICGQASAQVESCNAILALGMRNVVHVKQDAAATALKYSRNCGADFDKESNDTIIRTHAEVFGYFNGTGDGDVKTMREHLHQFCAVNKETSASSSGLISEASTIFQPSLDAWAQCVALNQNGLKVTPNIYEDQRLNVSLVYTGDTHSGIAFYKVKPDGFVCDTIIPGKGSSGPTSLAPNTLANAEISHEGISISCERVAAEHNVRRLGDATIYDRRAPAAVAIMTASRMPIVFAFSETWSPDIPSLNANTLREQMKTLALNGPPGTVVAFAGRLLPAGWLWCNGDLLLKGRDVFQPLFSARRNVRPRGWEDHVLLTGLSR